jgi:hypothetical protein
VESDTQASERGARPQLQPVDASGTATLYLNRAWRFGGEIWLLTQAGKPVGMVERTAGRIALRTFSGHWRGGARRRARRLGWHLYFTRAGGDGPALEYKPPSTLVRSGHFYVSGIRRYRLRCPMLRADWKLAAVPRGEISRIGARVREAWRVQLACVNDVVDEPVLLVVVLAACGAILIHDEQPSGGAMGV